MKAPNVLVTGAGGYLGTQLVAALAAGRAPVGAIVAVDVRETPAERRQPGVDYVTADVRRPGLIPLFDRHHIDVVVHLASIVTPGRDSTAEFEYSVDVEGTENVLTACTTTGVKRIIVSSSGAAYGYHADNPQPLDEDCPLRGNRSIPYAWHKRLVGEMLARWRERYPGLEQVEFRIGTILGETVNNQITDLFEKPLLIAVRGAASPFVFAWDQDVVACLLRAIGPGPAGIYNLCGDGTLDLDEIGRRLGKRCIHFPPTLLWLALVVLKFLGFTQYDPAQVNFLRYRPVLDNTRLKTRFGHLPQLASAEVFDRWWAAQRARA